MENFLDENKKRFLMDSQQNQNAEDDEVEYVPLPSQGVFYKGQFNHLKQLKVRKLNWTDENILTTQSYYDNGTIFDEILKRTIVDENGFKASELVPVDKDGILFWLRIGAFGREYKIKRKCPKCNKTNQVIWDLADFDMPELNAEYAEEIIKNGEIEIELPVSKYKIKITVPTLGKEKKVKQNLELKKTKGEIDHDFLVTGKLLSVISAYLDENNNWERDSTKISQFLHNKIKKIQDTRFIIAKAKEINLEINTKKDIVCKNSNCNHIEEGVDMPMSIYFFWPEFT